MTFCPVANSVAAHLAELDRMDAYDMEIERRREAILDSLDIDTVRQYLTDGENLMLTIGFQEIIRPQSDRAAEKAAADVRKIIFEGATRQAKAEYRRACADGAEDAAVTAYELRGWQ